MNYRCIADDVKLGENVTLASFVNLYGTPVKLTDGRTVVADDAYIRGCILTPFQQLVAGYPPLMPTFRGQVSEEQILQLIAYIKSLAAPKGGTQK